MSERSRDAALVGFAALVLRIPAFLAPSQLGFDDGQFAESVLAMRAGGLPFRDVFSSQGPLFLPLAWLGDLLTLRTIDSPRAIAVLSGAVLVAVVSLAAREVTDRAGAFLAAALVAISGSVLWTTGPLTSDGPAEALAAATVAVALAYRRAPSTRKIVAIGVLAGAAFSVKSLLVLPALVAAGLLVLARRRGRDLALVPAIAAGVMLVVALPWGLERVYEQSVQYHTDQAGQRAIGANFGKSVSTLVDRDAPLLATGMVVAAGALAALAKGRRAPRPSKPSGDLLTRIAGGVGPIVLWLVLTLVVLLLEAPMWRNHLAHAVPPAAILIGAAAVSTRFVALAVVAAVAVLPWQVPRLGDLLWPGDYTGHAAAAVRVLRDLPDGAQVISDDPGLVWRAGKRTPDQFVDASILRISSRRPSLRITEDDIVRAATRPEVCAVVRWSSERFGSFARLGARLERAGYSAVLAWPRSPDKVWVKRACVPKTRATAGPGTAPTGRTSAGAGPSRSPG